MQARQAVKAGKDRGITNWSEMKERASGSNEQAFYRVESATLTKKAGYLPGL